MATVENSPQRENRLLAMLPQEERERLLGRMKLVPLKAKDLLYDANQTIHFVLFPCSGATSQIITMKDGTSSEVSTIGNEGMVGMPVFLGTNRSPTKVYCQVPGEGLKMEAEDFRHEMSNGGMLHKTLHRYTQALLNQISQSSACNSLHKVEQRMCRWLLMTQDRVHSNQFSLTQEFLAAMMGVRRPTVTVTAGVLQKNGLIKYSRGKITIVDRKRLEDAACECYQVVRDEYDRLLG